MEHDEIMDMVMDHYEHPRNYGDLDDYDLIQNGGNSGCGDVITLYIKFSQDGERIKDIAFEGQGCIISQAAASIITENIKNTRLAEISGYDLEKMKEFLGKDMVIRRPRCSNLIIDTLKAAINRYGKLKRNDDIKRNVV